MSTPNEDALDEALLDHYIAGDEAAILEGEYARLVALATRFSEHRARRRPAPTAPTAVEIISRLAAELLPNGPAPSLSDALHALDHLFAAWQVESAAFQRGQARRLAYSNGQLGMLHAALGADERRLGG